MEIKRGNGTTEHGPGIDIELSGHEVFLAITAYLTTHDVHVYGPRTVRVNGEYIEGASIYVDPSGWIIAEGKELPGRGR